MSVFKVSHETCIADLVHQQRDKGYGLPPSWAGAACVVPTPAQCVARLGHYRPDKAIGEDRLGPELAHGWPSELGRLWHPAGVKALWWGAPPLQWTGGLIHELYKGKKSVRGCGNYRDVCLGVSSGKWFSAHLRSCVARPLAEAAVWSQFGSGLNGGTTEFAHLYVRAAMDAAGATGRSCAIVFLDCEKAFASVFPAARVRCAELGRGVP